MSTTVALASLFEVKTGNYHALSGLDAGDTPLVSCGGINHGFMGFFDIPQENTYSDVITIAYNGQPLTAKFRPYRFGAKDDVGVLIPRRTISQTALAYVAGLLNSMQWRFSYGRKCYKGKLQKIDIVGLPVIRNGDVVMVDEDRIEKIVGNRKLDLRPLTSSVRIRRLPSLRWVVKRLGDLFELERGQFHSLKELASGHYATVSRTENGNGVHGYYERPEGSVLYPQGLITVSTVSGDAFVQAEEFIATDNVVVCKPLKPMLKTTAYFIAALINRQKWRYGYGRQCYKEKLSALPINVPWRDGEMDEKSISKIVKKNKYWDFISGNFMPK